MQHFEFCNSGTDECTLPVVPELKGKYAVVVLASSAEYLICLARLFPTSTEVYGKIPLTTLSPKSRTLLRGIPASSAAFNAMDILSSWQNSTVASASCR